jgi:hypothetical protein
MLLVFMLHTAWHQVFTLEKVIVLPLNQVNQKPKNQLEKNEHVVANQLNQVNQIADTEIYIVPIPDSV